MVRWYLIVVWVVSFRMSVAIEFQEYNVSVIC